MIAKILLIISIIILFVSLTGKTYFTQAWKKVLLMFFMTAMVLFVLYPDLSTQIANILGIGRGADLLLYICTIMFIFFVFNTHIKLQELRQDMYKLARKIAINEAKSGLTSKKKK